MARANGPTSTGAALVLGGGVAGIQCSLDLAEGGYKVYLVEKSPALGGHMSQLDKTFPTNDCSMCTLAPKLVEAGRHLNIEIVTNSELTGLEGSPGDFKAKVFHHARFVDPDLCTSCGECAPVCPVVVADQYNEELGERKAIYKLYPQAIPNTYAVTKNGHSPCKRACAVHTSAQGYVALIAQERFADAYRVASEPNPFPAVCGRVCTHNCETDCTRGEVEQPIAIAGLKRFVSDFAFDNVPLPEPVAVDLRREGRHRRRRPERPLLRPRPGPARLQDDRLRGQARAGRHAALRHPRVPPAQGRPAAGHRPHSGARRRAAVRPGRRHRLHGRLAAGDGYQAVYLGVGPAGRPPAADPRQRRRGRLHGGRSAARRHPRQARRHGQERDRHRRRRRRLRRRPHGRAPGRRQGHAGLHRRRRRPCRPRPTRSKRVSTSRSPSSARACRPAVVAGPDGRAAKVEFTPARWARPTSAAGARRCPSTTPSASSPATPWSSPPARAWSTTSPRAPRASRSQEPGRDRQGRPRPPAARACSPAATPPRAVPGRPSRPSPPAAAARRAIHNFLRGEELSPWTTSPWTKPSPTTRCCARPRSWRACPCRTWPGAARKLTWDEVRTGFTAEQAVAEAKRCLNCAVCSECMECVRACGPGALLHGEQRPRVRRRGRRRRAGHRLRPLRPRRQERVRLRPLPQHPLGARVRAHALGLGADHRRGQAALQRRAPRRRSPSSSASARATRTTSTARASAACSPTSRRCSRSTTCPSAHPTSFSWTCAPRARASTPSTSALRTWASTSSARGPRTSKRTPRPTTC